MVPSGEAINGLASTMEDNTFPGNLPYHRERYIDVSGQLFQYALWSRH